LGKRSKSPGTGIRALFLDEQAQRTLRRFVADWVAPRWRQIATYDDAAIDATLLGATAYVLTTHGSPNGRLIELRLIKGDTLSTAKTVLPEGNLVLSNVAATYDGVYVAGQRDGIAHLLYLPDGKGPATEVPLPVRGTLVALRQSRDGSHQDLLRGILRPVRIADDHPGQRIHLVDIRVR